MLAQVEGFAGPRAVSEQTRAAVRQRIDRSRSGLKTFHDHASILDLSQERPLRKRHVNHFRQLTTPLRMLTIRPCFVSSTQIHKCKAVSVIRLQGVETS